MSEPVTVPSIFISHRSDEREAALVLKSHLQKVLPKELSIFVASDGESITGGIPWFNHIREAVKRSTLVLVLISRESLSQPWLLFEAGIGDGVGARVIPFAAW
jgi:TIR domain